MEGLKSKSNFLYTTNVRLAKSAKKEKARRGMARLRGTLGVGSGSRVLEIAGRSVKATYERANHWLTLRHVKDVPEATRTGLPPAAT